MVTRNHFYFYSSKQKTQEIREYDVSICFVFLCTQMNQFISLRLCFFVGVGMRIIIFALSPIGETAQPLLKFLTDTTIKWSYISLNLSYFVSILVTCYGDIKSHLLHLLLRCVIISSPDPLQNLNRYFQLL